eukprot:scaffold53143_cov23-Tisochrysis_lutea.AAC.2
MRHRGPEWQARCREGALQRLERNPTRRRGGASSHAVCNAAEAHKPVCEGGGVARAVDGEARAHAREAAGSGSGSRGSGSGGHDPAHSRAPLELIEFGHCGSVPIHQVHELPHALG